jgi:IS1 family transposase
MVSMNRLTNQERAQIIRALVEGNSIRSTVRMTGFAKNTISKLLVELGQATAAYQYRTLVELPANRIECDEIWSFVGMKAKTVPEERRDEMGVGDVWTWVAIDPDTKLVATYLVGDRGTEACGIFATDLRARIATPRPQITTDGHPAYVNAIADAFGPEVDYAMLVKQYGVDDNESASPTARRYSPNKVTGEEVRVIQGDPDPDKISTSFVERQNLTMRMSMRRFTRLTNGFSKKVENLAAAVSLHFMFYNFARPHGSLGRNMTPAMASGISNHVWTCEEIAALLD